MPNINTMIESKFLKKEDVGDPGDAAIVTFVAIGQKNVAKEDEEAEMKWCAKFREFQKPMVLNGTNLKLASMAIGSPNTEDWIGKTIELYHDPSITFGDKLVGGLRFRKSGGKVRQAATDMTMPDDIPF